MRRACCCCGLTAEQCLARAHEQTPDPEGEEEGKEAVVANVVNLDPLKRVTQVHIRDMLVYCNVWIRRTAVMCSVCATQVTSQVPQIWTIGPPLVCRYDKDKHRIPVDDLNVIRKCLRNALRSANKLDDAIDPPLWHVRYSDWLVKFKRSEVRAEYDSVQWSEDHAFDTEMYQWYNKKQPETDIDPWNDDLGVQNHRTIAKYTNKRLNHVVYFKCTDWDCYVLTRLTRTQVQIISQRCQRSAHQVFLWWNRVYRYKSWEEQSVLTGISRSSLVRMFEDTTDVLFRNWAMKQIICDRSTSRWTREEVWQNTTEVAKMVWQLSINRLCYVLDGGYQFCRQIQTHHILFVCVCVFGGA